MLMTYIQTWHFFLGCPFTSWQFSIETDGCQMYSFLCGRICIRVDVTGKAISISLHNVISVQSKEIEGWINWVQMPGVNSYWFDLHNFMDRGIWIECFEVKVKGNRQVHCSTIDLHERLEVSMASINSSQAT